jgi:hypothetical protein
VCDTDSLLTDYFGKFHVVVVDELQDLLAAQTLRLIKQAPCPVVMIGDLDQRIYEFADTHSNTGCDEMGACELVPENMGSVPEMYEWYGSWRLDELTVAFVEDYFGKRMSSYRHGVVGSVRFCTKIEYSDNALVLCRTNENVIKTAKQYNDMRIVSGNSIASKLQSARCDSTRTMPMAVYAQSMDDERFGEVVDMLKSRSVTTRELNSSKYNISCVGTVHQLKGFEYPKCVVHDDVLGSEKEIVFVACSRHTDSLTILLTPTSSSKAFT